MTQEEKQIAMQSAAPGEQLRVMISKREIDARLAALAAEIRRDYGDKTVTMVGALKGSVIFLADLARKIDGPVEFDFIKASSYGNSCISSGKVLLEMPPSLDWAEKHILLVEDIIDTGRTLVFLREFIENQNPASVKICALLDKPDRREVVVDYDYIGFTIPDDFVVGYGLDYAQRYRNLPFIGILQFD